MKAFNRILPYVQTQWNRVVLTISCALIVAVLLSVSYVTVIPILKVMLSDDSQGLHSWIEAKVCSRLYGIEFRDAETVISHIDKDGLGYRSGLSQYDQILGIEDDPNLSQDISYARLLQYLASPAAPVIPIIVAQDTNDLRSQRVVRTLDLLTPRDPNAIDSLGWGWGKQAQWQVELAALGWGQKLLIHLPRENTSENTMKAIVLIVEIMLMVTFLRCIAKYFQAYLAEKIVQVIVTDLRRDVFSHVMRMPMGYFSNEKPSDCMSRIVKDTGEMAHALKIMLGKAIREPLNALVALSFAMYLNWQLTLIFLGGGPFVLILVAQFGKRMKRASRKTLEAGSQMLSKLQETMSGLKVVKVYNQQAHEEQAFARINFKLLKQQLKISRVEAATSPALEIMGMAAACAALVVGASWVTQANIKGAEFMGLLVLLGASAEAARKASDVWNKIQKANAAAERIFSLLDEDIEVEVSSAPSIKPLKQAIEFRDITFTYPGTTQPVLQHVNLTIKAGETVAVVGPNGSGKTTLASLLPRFYDPDSGQILLDGQDIHLATLSSLRDQIGMVTQNVVSFNNTVASNIAYAKPDASMDEIIQAAKQAFAHEFILNLPCGYDTLIGERGTGLSGGQLQRIVIARAILKNPGILIFDEATSQVDAESESKIHRAIEKLMAHRTTLIIAHRFSTVVAADQIVVINKGQVAAQGTHQELIKTCKIYRGLYETQLVQP
jgi:ABC-type multidrug transport system fused ATPase/permease subunit